MGQVWPGEHQETGEEVVLKFFDPKTVTPGTPGWELRRQLFGQEASVELQGDHLISSKHHLGLSDPWRPVLVMERAACSLNDILRDLRKNLVKLPLAVIKQILADAAQGLHRLHTNHERIHDDVKPGNVFLRLKPSGRRYQDPASLLVWNEEEQRYAFEGAIGDFGVARKIDHTPRGFAFTQDGGYKAPEQLQAKVVADPRTDLFGFGQCIQDLLAFSQDPVPTWLKRQARQCTNPDLDRRPRSARDVAWELSSQRDQFRGYGLEPDRHNPFVQRQSAHRAFEQFRRDPGLRLLHMKGDPGTGKTALMTHWADQLAPGAAYFLSCIGAASLEDALTHLLQTLSSAFGVSVQLPTRLDARGVLDLLTAIVRAPDCPIPEGESLYVYIEALDEADNPSDVGRLIPADVPERIKLIVSSRHEPPFPHLDAAPRRLEVALDAPGNQESNLREAEEFCRNRLFPVLPETLCTEVARALGANFQLIAIYSSSLKERGERGELDLAEVSSELAELATDFSGTTRGEDAFHRFYRRYVWEPALDLVKHDDEQIDKLTQLVGLLAAAEAPLQVRVLRLITGRQSDHTVESLLRPFRRCLRKEVVQDGRGESRPAYRYAHKTLQTFVTSRHGPVNDPDQLAGYRDQLLKHYADRPIPDWDHFGLRSVVRLCLRQGRLDEAASWLKRHEFLQTVVMARGAGLGVDGLREMVRLVREADGPYR